MNQQQRKQMKVEDQKEITRVVEWCMKRADNLSEDDALALLAEFDEWIGFQEMVVNTLDLIKIKCI